MRLAPFLFLVAIPLLLPSTYAQGVSVNPELLKQVVNYCVVREQSLQMMIEGRERGVQKGDVLAKLPPLTGDSNDAERATYSRLDDVYGMPRLQTKTLSAHRFYACVQAAMDNRPPDYAQELEESLLECQAQPGSSDDHGRCVRAAQRKHLKR